MEPIRILQVATIMNRGGLETMLMNYYRKMDRSRIQFDFMVHREEQGHYDEEILSLGGRIYRMPQIRPGNYRLYFKRLDQFFSAHLEYQVVHAHLNENSSFVLRAARKAGVPCRIAHSHLSDLGLDLKLPFRLYARFAMKDHPSRYFACSTNAGKWLFGNRSAEEITILNNAVDVEEFKFNAETRKKMRAELGAGERFVIGHIGRFNKQKNHDFLLDIFAAVHKRDLDSILLLIGDGVLRAQIVKKADRLGLTDAVQFLGTRTDIPDLMQAMDLFVFPSRFEGLPVVMIEAQAAGLNCIVASTITPEMDVTGRVKFRSLADTPEAWAAEILASSSAREETSHLLRMNHFDTSTMADWLADYYISQSRLG